MCTAYSTANNRVIDSLPDEVRLRWLRHMEIVTLQEHLTLHECCQAMHYAYFPTTAVVSIVHVTTDGKPIELAAVGNEGMVGIEILLGGGAMPNRAYVVATGEAFRLPAAQLQEEVDLAGSASHVLLRYALALSTQVAQCVVCNRHHSLCERLCRWLLTNLDYSQGNGVMATHRQIAYALGVRRESVSEDAMRLQSLGLICYARGRVLVLDRQGLEQQACECYGVVKGEFDKLLPWTRSTLSPTPNRRDFPIRRSHQTMSPLLQ